MVVETEYYDILHVTPDATELDIKKAYRKLAIQLHPDKNPGDEGANKKFQQIGEAYQVLSDKGLRSKYDKNGKDAAMPNKGFEDPVEFFNIIFGGNAFVDWIGEISLMKDLTKRMEIQGKNAEESEGVSSEDASKHMAPKLEELADEGSKSDSSNNKPFISHMQKSSDLSSTLNNSLVISSAARTSKSTDENRQDSISRLDRERDKSKEKKKPGLTKEQREELQEYEREQREIREARVKDLEQKLIKRLNDWIESDHGKDRDEKFRNHIKNEAESLKMESFGLVILQAIGTTYIQKATSFMKSQKLLGLPGLFYRLKDKTSLVRDTWTTISTAIDVQSTMDEMARMEEKGGADWTDERKADYEHRVSAKILMAAWLGSKFEIQFVLRDVCDRVLSAQSEPSVEKRMERAKGLMIIGGVFMETKRDPDEEGDFAFEQIMAESARKPEKKIRRASKKHCEGNASIPTASSQSTESAGLGGKPSPAAHA